MNNSDYEYAGLPVDYHVVLRHNYYDMFNGPYARAAGGDQTNITNGTGSSSTSYGSSRSIFVLAARIGFILIQMGSIPVHTLYQLILYNVAEIGVSMASYGLIGVIFSVGPQSLAGAVGYTFYSDTSEDLDAAILGVCACLLGTAQMSTFLIGRLHTGGALLLTFLYSAIFQPIISHWIWNELGWMNKFDLVGTPVGVRDHAGGIVVHLTSGIIGTIGALFLGRRLVKLKDVDPFTFGMGNVAGTTFGYILIIIGYISMSFPTMQYLNVHTPEDYIGQAALNSLLGISGGIIMVTFMHYKVYGSIYNYWTIQRCIQGGVAGMVAVASGVDAYACYSAFLIAAIVALFFFFFAAMIHNTAMEDCCNATSIYLVCGFLGALICPLVAQRDNVGNTVDLSTRAIHFLWQLICLIVIVLVTILFGLIVFASLRKCNILRNQQEIVSHRRGLALQYSLTKRGYLERLFMVNTQTDHLVPGYRRKFSDLPFNSPHKSPTKIKFADDVKAIKSHGKQLDRDVGSKRDVRTVNYFSTNTTWPVAGSGDYCGEYSDSAPSQDCEKPTEIFSLYRSSVLNKYENKLDNNIPQQGFLLE